MNETPESGDNPNIKNKLPNTTLTASGELKIVRQPNNPLVAVLDEVPGLDSEEKDFFSRWCCGEEAGSISQSVKKSFALVDNAIHRAKYKIRDHIKGEKGLFLKP